jgi:hypothetical protein
MVTKRGGRVSWTRNFKGHPSSLYKPPVCRSSASHPRVQSFASLPCHPIPPFQSVSHRAEPDSKCRGTEGRRRATKVLKHPPSQHIANLHRESDGRLLGALPLPTIAATYASPFSPTNNHADLPHSSWHRGGDGGAQNLARVFSANCKGSRRLSRAPILARREPLPSPSLTQGPVSLSIHAGSYLWKGHKPAPTPGVKQAVENDTRFSSSQLQFVAEFSRN